MRSRQGPWLTKEGGVLGGIILELSENEPINIIQFITKRKDDIMTKRFVSLAAALAVSFSCLAVNADAAGVGRAEQQKVITVNEEPLTVYVGTVCLNEEDIIRYVYSDTDEVSDAVLQVIKDAINDKAYTDLINDGKLNGSTSHADEMDESWKDASNVAAKHTESTHTVTDTSDTVGYDDTAYKALVTDAAEYIAFEKKTAEEYDEGYSARKAAWEADPENDGMDYAAHEAYLPPVTVSAPNNASFGFGELEALAKDAVVADEATMGYNFVGGKLIMLTNTNRTVIRIVNTSAEVTTRIPGDANGDKSVDVKDITTINQYIAHWNVAINLKNADVNGDGDVTVKDVTLIKQKLAKWNVELV